MLLNPHPICGHIPAIASKSHAHRLLICAALADRPSRILCQSPAEDIAATLSCLEALGATCQDADGCFQIHPIRLRSGPIHCCCGESGSTLRFLLPVAAALGADITFHLRGRLPERPMEPLCDALGAHGCTITRPARDLLHCTGQLRGGLFPLAGDISSQFLSGLLLALPLCAEPSEVRLTTPLHSAGYVELTSRTLAGWGIRIASHSASWHIPGRQSYHAPAHALRVEGDWSNAAFWLCAGAVSAPICVSGLSADSPQGDRVLPALLRRFGAQVVQIADRVTVSPAPLRGISLNAADIPDLVPPLALVAACADGVTQITGAARLRLKESDRLSSVAALLRSLGGQAEILDDGLFIHGTGLSGGSVAACNDHRIAMLAGIASGVCPHPIDLTGADAVRKSYPGFWADLAQLKEG